MKYKYATCNCGMLVRLEIVTSTWQGTCPDKFCQMQLVLTIRENDAGTPSQEDAEAEF